MSIAVLRTFISKRKQEYESKMLRKLRTGQKIAEEEYSKHVEEDASLQLMVKDNDSNGNMEEGVTDAFPSTSSSEVVKTEEVKFQHELKPPRVLEVLIIDQLVQLLCF